MINLFCSNKTNNQSVPKDFCDNGGVKSFILLSNVNIVQYHSKAHDPRDRVI